MDGLFSATELVFPEPITRKYKPRDGMRQAANESFELKTGLPKPVLCNL